MWPPEIFQYFCWNRDIWLLNSWYFSISGPADHTLLPIDQPNRPNKINSGYSFGPRYRAGCMQILDVLVGLLSVKIISFLFGVVYSTTGTHKLYTATLFLTFDWPKSRLVCKLWKFKAEDLEFYKIERFRLVSLYVFINIWFYIHMYLFCLCQGFQGGLTEYIHGLWNQHYWPILSWFQEMNIWKNTWRHVQIWKK